MIELRVPFKKSFFYREKRVKFLFNIGTLEAACKRLNLDFHDMASGDSYDMTLAILYEGYRSAQKERRKRDRYTLNHAVIWIEHMNRKEREKFVEAMTEVMGVTKGEGEKKK